MDVEGAVRRAGFWRRAMAVVFDLLVVLVPLQLVVAALFVQSNGLIQGRFGLSTQSCIALSQLPEGLRFSIENPTHASDCSWGLFGLTTSRLLTVSRSETKGTYTKTVSQSFWLDSQGQLTDRPSHDVSWIAMLMFVAYGLLLEVRSGRTLGDRLTGIRVASAEDVQAVGVPATRAIGRRLACLIGLLPIVAIHAPLFNQFDENAMLGYKGSNFFTIGWYVTLGLAFVWFAWIVVSMARKRDPIYDRLAKTVVLRA